MQRQSPFIQVVHDEEPNPPFLDARAPAVRTGICPPPPTGGGRKLAEAYTKKVSSLSLWPSTTEAIFQRAKERGISKDSMAYIWGAAVPAARELP